MVNVDFRNKTVFLDTAPLIYFIEGHSPYQEKLNDVFGQNSSGEFVFLTSAITLLEVLVKPLREGKTELAVQYKNILMEAGGVQIIDVSSLVAIKAAELRASYGLKTPDSIQLAICIEYNADYFLTNDVKLKNVKEVNVITLLEI
jgi:predicted nucleic acid-binding protein